MSIQSIIVLGGGSAGFMVALTLKRKLRQLHVKVIRSPDIGVIGVGEGTTLAFPKHLAMLVGQNVPHNKPYTPTQKERDIWRNRCNTCATDARRALSVKGALEIIRKPGMKWT